VSAQQGLIPGLSVHARAVALAGALAELGVTRLTLLRLGVRVELAPRQTNLPDLVVDAVRSDGAVQLESPQLGAHFEITNQSGTWRAAESSIAERLRSRFEQE
jgi:hypothetical protein